MADELPPVDGFEYPEKPTGDVDAWDMMVWMEKVDRYWPKRGFQKLDHNNDDASDESDVDRD